MVPAIAGACFGLGAASCTHTENSRLELGAIERTSTFRLQQAPVDDPAGPRAHWGTMVVISPIDGVRHGASPRIIEIPDTQDPPREYGLYPTRHSAVALEPDPWGNSVVRTVGEIGGSLLALIDPRFWRLGDSDAPWSPRRVWKRTPPRGSWSSGRPAVAAPEADTP